MFEVSGGGIHPWTCRRDQMNFVLYNHSGLRNTQRQHSKLNTPNFKNEKWKKNLPRPESSPSLCKSIRIDPNQTDPRPTKLTSNLSIKRKYNKTATKHEKRKADDLWLDKKTILSPPCLIMQFLWKLFIVRPGLSRFHSLSASTVKSAALPWKLHSRRIPLSYCSPPLFHYHYH